MTDARLWGLLALPAAALTAFCVATLAALGGYRAVERALPEECLNAERPHPNPSDPSDR